MSRFIKIAIDGDVQTHAPSESGIDYATLCGLDGDDPGCGQSTVPTPNGAKIDCPNCYAIFMAVKRFRKSDFKDKP